MTKAVKNIELWKRINDMFSFLEEQTRAITEYSDTLVRRLIEKITIHDNKAVVEFKSGLQSESGDIERIFFRACRIKLRAFLYFYDKIYIMIFLLLLHNFRYIPVYF